MSFKKALCLVFAVCLVLSSMFMISVTSQNSATKGTINDDGVRLRSEPSISSQQLYRFSKGQVVDIIEKVEGQEAEAGHGTVWYKVSTAQHTGYVYGYYVTEITEEAPPVPPPPDFIEQLQQFPKSYQDALVELHNSHPNWIFVADKFTMSFDAAVASQYNEVRKMVELNQGIAWRSLQKDMYDWTTDTWKILDNTTWVAASKEVVEFYMDPRNFFDETYIYMFMEQSYNKAYQNEEGLLKILNGTFLANGYTPNANDEVDALYNGSYVKVIMAAAEQSGISPYVIAAKIITEQGTSGNSELISGTNSTYPNYYNFFNWGAYGSGQQAVISSGLATAKSEGWDSRADAIIGGAKKLSNGYIEIGQDTYYYMNFNVVNPNSYWHQYAGSAYDSSVKAANLSKAYKGNFDDAPLVFSIPVFTDMPEEKATKPEKGDNRYNNYYLTSMTVDGLSPAFNMYIYNYNLSVAGDTTIYIKTPETASVVSPLVHMISRGDNVIKITVKSQTEYTNSYVLNVTSQQNGTLTFKLGDPSEGGGEVVTPPTPPPDEGEDIPTTPPQYSKGDTNDDGKVSLTDIVNIKRHILGIEVLTGSNLLAADANGDEKISLSDIVAVKRHILGIEQL